MADGQNNLGDAFVEIGGKLDGLDAAIKTAFKMTSDGATRMGAVFSNVGGHAAGAMTKPLAGALKKMGGVGKSAGMEIGAGVLGGVGAVLRGGIGKALVGAEAAMTVIEFGKQQSSMQSLAQTVAKHPGDPENNMRKVLLQMENFRKSFPGASGGEIRGTTNEFLKFGFPIDDVGGLLRDSQGLATRNNMSLAATGRELIKVRAGQGDPFGMGISGVQPNTRADIMMEAFRRTGKESFPVAQSRLSGVAGFIDRLGAFAADAGPGLVNAAIGGANILGGERGMLGRPGDFNRENPDRVASSFLRTTIEEAMHTVRVASEAEKRIRDGRDNLFPFPGAEHTFINPDLSDSNNNPHFGVRWRSDNQIEADTRPTSDARGEEAKLLGEILRALRENKRPVNDGVGPNDTVDD